MQYFVHPNRRTVHDRIAETIVVDDRPASAVPEDEAGVDHPTAGSAAANNQDRPFDGVDTDGVI